MLPGETERTRRRRPFGVWLILIYQVSGALLSIFSWKVLRHFPQNAAQKTYHEHLSTFDYVSFQVVGIIDWTATILLFLLRRLAVPLLLLGFALNIANAARLALSSNWLEALGQGLGVEVVLVAIQLAILAYAIRLLRRGILD